MVFRPREVGAIGQAGTAVLGTGYWDDQHQQHANMTMSETHLHNHWFSILYFNSHVNRP
jgi:hypothetical protein